MNSWQMYWGTLDDESRESFKRSVARWHGMIAGVGADGTCESVDVVAEIRQWTGLENDVLTAYADWLARARRAFEGRGIPWTTGELARRPELWEVDE